MSDAAVFAILAAIPTTLTGIGTLYLLIRNSKKADENSKKADEKSDKIVEQGGHIYRAVNSNLDKLKADIATGNATIAELKAVIEGMKTTAVATESKAQIADLTAKTEAAIEKLDEKVATIEAAKAS